MHTSRWVGRTLGLFLLGCAPLEAAQAQLLSTWVSSAIGDDGHDCSRATPCKTFVGALPKTSPGGAINVLEPGDYGPALIQQSVSIINNTGGTATTFSGVFGLDEAGTANATVVIIAQATGVVTLRGLTISSSGFGGDSGVAVSNAQQVNIENCAFIGLTAPAILVSPNVEFFEQETLPSTLNVKIENTTVTGSAGAVRIVSVPGTTVNASISHSSFQNNTGGGIRIDGTGGGTVTASISDIVSSMNNGNGVLAISGPGNAAAHVTHSVIAENVAYGVQSNQTSGGLAAVSVDSSIITNNGVGQVGSIGGGRLLTAGNNLLVGLPGTGFSGPIGLQ